jgi:hypothetical protein
MGLLLGRSGRSSRRAADAGDGRGGAGLEVFCKDVALFSRVGGIRLKLTSAALGAGLGAGLGDPFDSGLSFLMTWPIWFERNDRPGWVVQG